MTDIHPIYMCVFKFKFKKSKYSSSNTEIFCLSKSILKSEKQAIKDKYEQYIPLEMNLFAEYIKKF